MNAPVAASGPARMRAAPLALLCAVVLIGCASQPGPGAAGAGASSSIGEAGSPGGASTPPNPGDPATTERRARVRLELAALYFSRGQSNTALDELKLAMAANPDMPEAHNLRGLIYASMGDAAGAEQSFRRALELSARDGDTMNNYAWFLCQQRRYDEADAIYQRVTDLPNYGEAQRTLLARGVCQARAGHWAEAERTLSRSYELDPSNPVTAFNLSEVLLRRGELQRARFYARRINQVAEAVTAQSLWLAARIERRLGNMEGVQDFGRQLRERFPQSPEALQYERGRFED